MDYDELVDKVLKKLDRMYTQNYDGEEAKAILNKAVEEVILITLLKD